MKRPIPALVTTAVVAVPAAGVFWIVTHPSSAPAHPAATPTPQTTHKSTTQNTMPATAQTHTYTGPSVDMEWGPVQVTIVVKDTLVTDIRATAPTERPRSAFINEQAIPLLRQEALQAQSANIDLISGATLTSEAYAESLQGALDKAHLGGSHS